MKWRVMLRWTCREKGRDEWGSLESAGLLDGRAFDSCSRVAVLRMK
jgi:hypothetical protein